MAGPAVSHRREGKGLASKQTEGNGSGFSLGWRFVNPENW